MMNCNSPPPIADRDLLAYLDGEAGEEVAAHLDRCPHCRERAEELAKWQRALTTRLYRHDCPPASRLGEYHLGLLARDEAAAVGTHLEACPHCRREVAGLDAYLHDLQPSLASRLLGGAQERMRVVIARLSNAGGAALAPAYAGLRGEEQAPIVYEAQEIQITVEIQDDAGAPGRKALLGLVIGLEPPDGQVSLWQAGQQIALAPVDELGNFVIPDLAAGSYDLIVSGSEVEVHIQELAVGTA
ncbi:MAG: zf-HC2 domain-containing protein [Anaerolineae bacterium]